MKNVRLLAVITTVCVVIAASSRLYKVFGQSNQTVEHDWNATYTGQNLNHPSGLFKMPAANGGIAADWLFIADTGNNQIKLFQPGVGLQVLAGSGTKGNADGSPQSAQFFNPTGLGGPGYITRTDPSHNGEYSSAVRLSVFDTGNNVLKTVCVPMLVDGQAPICTSGGSVTTSSPGTTLSSPAMGTNAYVANTGQHTLVAFDPSGNGTVLAGTSGTPGYTDGPLAQAQFAGPTKVVSGLSGNMLVADAGNFVIRQVSNGSVSTLAGSGQRGYQDGPAGQAMFELPLSVAYNSSDGATYVADTMNYCIRKIDSSGNVTTYAGSHTVGNQDGTLTQALFASPVDLIIDSGIMYISDSGNNSIREINMSTGQVTTLIK